MERRCPDCGVSMEPVTLKTVEHDLRVYTGERQDGLLGKLGVSEKAPVESVTCPECGLVRTYAAVEE